MEKRIIEINGVKMEVDLREAVTIESYKVGQQVKVLVESGYSDKKYTSHFGTIVGFDNFEKLPTVLIAYLENNCSPEIKIVYFNNETTGIEICPCNENDIFLDKQSIIEKFDNDIFKKQAEIKDIEVKKDYFIKRFGKYFKE
jgi:hypothetical protein